MLKVRISVYDSPCKNTQLFSSWDEQRKCCENLIPIFDMIPTFLGSCRGQTTCFSKVIILARDERNKRAPRLQVPLLPIPGRDESCHVNTVQFRPRLSHPGPGWNPPCKRRSTLYPTLQIFCRLRSDAGLRFDSKFSNDIAYAHVDRQSRAVDWPRDSTGQVFASKFLGKFDWRAICTPHTQRKWRMRRLASSAKFW